MVSVVDADLFHGAEHFEPLPQVRPGRALLDLADVDDSPFLDLALLVLLEVTLLLCPALTLTAETFPVVAPGRKKKRQKGQIKFAYHRS